MKKLIIITGVAVVGLFLYWTISPLFINETVDDALPPGVALTDDVQVDVSFTSEEELQAIIETMPDVEMDDEMPREVQIVPIPSTPDEAAARPSIFPIEDTRGHSATGNIRVIDTDDTAIVRYEDYDGTNGPDLFVYLAKDLDAEEFVSLGRARGNMGNINYTVPEDVDLSEYRYVMTWCRAFGVLFDYAEINPDA